MTRNKRMEILIKDLFENFDISVRAYNACDKVRIKSIEEAKKHFEKYGTFVNIQNCGAKTSKELIDAIERYSNEDAFPLNQEIALIQETPINHKLSDKAIHDLIVSELHKLSVRARNGLLHFFGNKVPSKDQVKDYFIDNKFEVRKLKHIGKKSEPEVISFINAVTDIFYKSAYLPLTEKTKAFTTFYDLVGFKVENEYWLKKYEERRIPIIVFAAQHISELFELKEVDAFIFKNDFYLLERIYSLDEIAERYGVSRERIRQRRDQIKPTIHSKAAKLATLLPYSNYSQAIPPTPIICIPTDIVDEKLFDEIKQTSDIFANLILSALASDKWYTINPLDKLQKPSLIQHYNIYSSLKAMKKSYLIERSIIDKDTLLKICSDILAAIVKSQAKDISIDVAQIYKGELSDDGLTVISNIIGNHFGIEMEGYNIPISRNSSKPIYEFIAETLLKIGKPSHLSEIREEMLKVLPGFDSSEQSIRAAINHKKDIFINFGRTSTYGLKNWEKKNTYIKGGTIRSIVIEYLKAQDGPCHISSITEQVRRYRKTDERSVLTNLKYTKKPVFYFLRGGYVGLLGKKQANKSLVLAKKGVVLDDLLKGIFSK